MTDNDDSTSTDALDEKTKKPQTRYSQLIPLSEKGYTVIGTRNDLMVIPKVTPMPAIMDCLNLAVSKFQAMYSSSLYFIVREL